MKIIIISYKFNIDLKIILQNKLKMTSELKLASGFLLNKIYNEIKVDYVKNEWSKFIIGKYKDDIYIKKNMHLGKRRFNIVYFSGSSSRLEWFSNVKEFFKKRPFENIVDEFINLLEIMELNSRDTIYVGFSRGSMLAKSVIKYISIHPYCLLTFGSPGSIKKRT